MKKDQKPDNLPRRLRAAAEHLHREVWGEREIGALFVAAAALIEKGRMVTPRTRDLLERLLSVVREHTNDPG